MSHDSSAAVTQAPQVEAINNENQQVEMVSTESLPLDSSKPKRTARIVYFLLALNLFIPFMGIVSFIVVLANKHKAKGTFVFNHMRLQMYTFLAAFVGMVLAGVFAQTYLGLFFFLFAFIGYVMSIIYGYIKLEKDASPF